MTAARKTILIVEDDNSFRSALIETLSHEGYMTLEARNGKIARDIIRATDCDLVLSDIQMPHMTGSELVEWYRDEYPDTSTALGANTPFILMTGFSNNLTNVSATDPVIRRVFSKPFKSKDLLSTIKQVLESNRNEKDSGTSLREQGITYCKVSMEDFVTEKDVQMDVFIRLPSSKYVKVAHQGGKLSKERIDRYREKGISQLYIKKEDFKKVLDFNIKLTRLLMGSQQVDTEKKQRFLAHTAEVILENTFVNGIDEETFHDAKDFVMTSMDLLTTDEQTFEMLNILNAHTDHLYAHSLGVSIYSGMIARAMKISSSATLFKLTFGGLVHDIGKKEIDPEILNKSRALLSHQERMILETHPARGKAILESLKSAPSEVIAIAHEHHENYLGQGFPRRIDRRQIHPLAKMTALADDFCLYALKGPHNPGMSAPKAWSLLYEVKRDYHDPNCLEALRSLIKN